MTSAILLKKQEELNAKRVRDLLRLPENKKCFDCPIKSPFFVNVTLSTFVCTRCSGLVREVGHRVKSISASTFTGPELVALELGGNGIASKIWLSCGYNTADTPEPESDGDVRGFMRQKYYERKWLNYDLAVSHDLSVKDRIKELFTEDGLPKQQQRRRRSTMEHNTNTNTNGLMDFDSQRLKKTIPTSLNMAMANRAPPPTIQTAPLIMNSGQSQQKLSSPNQSKVGMMSKTPNTVPVSPLPTLHSASPMGSFFADLAGLTLSDASTQIQTEPQSASSHQPQYSNGILAPTSLNRTNIHIKENNNIQQTIQPTTTSSASQTMISDNGSLSSHKRATSLQDTDPYSALRSHHSQNQQRYQETISAIQSIAATSPSSTNITKKQDTNADPYSALRRFSDGPDKLSFDSPPLATINNVKVPLSTTTIHWTSSPTKQQQHQPAIPIHSTQGPSRQDKAYSKKKTDEWVQAGLHLTTGDDDDDEDVMAQVSSSTSYSATSSTTSRKTNNNKDAFSDLDPLAAFKQNKMTTSSFGQSNH